MIDNDKISSTQLWIYIVMIVVGIGIFTLPRQVAETTGQDGWITVILGGVISFLNYYIITRLARRFPEDTLVEISNKVVGKYIAFILLLLFWLYMLFINAMSLRIFGEVVKMTLLIKTPVEVIIISILILALWLVRGGIEPIVRFVGIIFPIIIITVIIVIGFAVPRTDFSNLLPIMRTSPSELLKGVYTASYSYSGYESVLLIIPFIKNSGSMLKSGVIAFAIIIAIYVSLVVISLCRFGVTDVKLLIWPTLTTIRSIEVPGSFIERLEGVVMAQWILLAFTTIVPLLYGMAVLPSRMFKHREFRHLCTFAVPIVYFLSLLPGNIVETYKFLGYIVNYLEAPLVFLMPAMLLIVSYIRKVGRRANG